MAVRPVRCSPSLLAEDPEYADQMIRHFFLPGLLAEGHILTLNVELGTLSLLVIEQGLPYQALEQQFTATQVYLLLALLESYPYYCPHELLLAAFTTGRSLTEEIVERYRKRLHEASLVPGLWDQEMKPTRNALSRLRLKLRAFAINVHPIVATGYLLIREPQLASSYRAVVAISSVGSEGTHEERRAAEGAAPVPYRSQARPASIAARVG